MNERRNFLKTACKPIVLAALGIPMLEACSTDELSSNNTTRNGPSNTEPKKPITINIKNGLFSDLEEVGGWMNYTAEELLLVRISGSEIRAFDNKCPHQGNRDRWTYDGSQFTCQYHNNSFSNSCSGSLTCYETSLEGDVLTISFD
ncbi:MAG: Rieske (2Fe-2S) protein [Flavobacteriaceae bacterium]